MNYRELIDKYIDLLWFMALRLTKHKEDAEDLVQETCLKAFEKLDTLKEEAKAKGWLLRILINTFINGYCREREGFRGGVFEVNFEDPIFYKDGEHLDPEKEILSKVMDEEINKAIEALPSEYKIILLLIDIEDLSYKEVEEILRIPAGTIASRLYRGRRMLRDSLYEYAKKKGFFRRKRDEL